MKSFFLLAAASIFGTALAGPIEIARAEEPANFEVPVKVDSGLPLHLKVDKETGVIFTEITNATIAERDEASLTKRDLITVHVYQDINRGGRHEALLTTTQVCYDLYNGWNDAISSVGVQPGYACYFHVNGGCSGGYLHTGGELLNTHSYGFGDNISSYRCY